MRSFPAPLVDLVFFHIELLSQPNSRLTRWHLTFVLVDSLPQNIHLFLLLVLVQLGGSTGEDVRVIVSLDLESAPLHREILQARNYLFHLSLAGHCAQLDHSRPGKGVLERAACLIMIVLGGHF